MQYESVHSEENAAHLARHLFSGPLDIGSRFTLGQEAAAALLEEVDTRLREHFEASMAEGKEPGRLEFKIQKDFVVGTEALVELSGVSGTPFSMTRDEGTKDERSVNVVLADDRDIPSTNVVTVIAGPYGPTGVWGIYTMFPGEDSGCPFPNEKQPEDLRSQYTEYWENHGFLVTPETVSAHVEKYRKELDAIREETAREVRAAFELGKSFNHYTEEEERKNGRQITLIKALASFNKGKEVATSAKPDDPFKKSLG